MGGCWGGFEVCCLEGGDGVREGWGGGGEVVWRLLESALEGRERGQEW